jgi:hypothetical protein
LLEHGQSLLFPFRSDVRAGYSDFERAKLGKYFRPTDRIAFRFVLA